MMNVSKLSNARQKNLRCIDWYEQTCRSISSLFPEMRTHDAYIVAQLSSLLLERLTSEVAKKLLEILPEEAASEYYGSLLANAFADANTSIGYPDFIQKASYALGVCSLDETKAEKLAEHFLWTITQDFPYELKQRMAEELPLELSSRMSLYSSQSDESKVG